MHAEFALFAGYDICADMLRPHLEAEANAENGNAEIEYCGIEWRRLGVHRRRSARDDDAGRLHRTDIFGRDLCRICDEAVHAELCNLLHDQMIELRSHREEHDKVPRLANAKLLCESSERFLT